MRTWNSLIRVVVGAGVLGAVLLGPARSSPVAAAPIGGQWLLTSDMSCTPSAANAKVCGMLLGPFDSFVNPVSLTSDSQGHLRFFATYVATEHAHGAATTCSPAIFDKPFIGTCRAADHGTGMIKKGATGLPDFWVSEETATFYGAQALRGVHDPAGTKNYPLDTGIPMVPGYYDAARYLALLGIHQAPAGVTVRIVVTHDQ